MGVSLAPRPVLPPRQDQARGVPQRKDAASEPSCSVRPWISTSASRYRAGRESARTAPRSPPAIVIHTPAADGEAVTAPRATPWSRIAGRRHPPHNARTSRASAAPTGRTAAPVAPAAPSHRRASRPRSHRPQRPHRPRNPRPGPSGPRADGRRRRLPRLLRRGRRISPRRRAGREIGPGYVLRGRYLLEAALGRGGTGTVFEAIDRYRLASADGGQRVALKVLHGQAPNQLADLRHEFQHLQSLAHPNIVRAHEYDRDGDVAFFTMEYLGGLSLNRVCRRARLAVGAARRAGDHPRHRRGAGARACARRGARRPQSGQYLHHRRRGAKSARFWRCARPARGCSAARNLVGGFIGRRTALCELSAARGPPRRCPR